MPRSGSTPLCKYRNSGCVLSVGFGSTHSATAKRTRLTEVSGSGFQFRMWVQFATWAPLWRSWSRRVRAFGVVTDGECVSELVEWFSEFAALGLSMIALGVFFTLVMEFSWTAGLRPEGYLEAGCGWLGPAFQNLGTLVGTSEVYRVRSHCLRTG